MGLFSFLYSLFGEGWRLFVGICACTFLLLCSLFLISRLKKDKKRSYITDLTYTSFIDNNHKVVMKFSRGLGLVRVLKIEYSDNDVMSSKSICCSKKVLEMVQAMIEEAGIKRWKHFSISDVPADHTLFVAYGSDMYFILNVYEQPKEADELFNKLDLIVRELGF